MKNHLIFFSVMERIISQLKSQEPVIFISRKFLYKVIKLFNNDYNVISNLFKLSVYLYITVVITVILFFVVDCVYGSENIINVNNKDNNSNAASIAPYVCMHMEDSKRVVTTLEKCSITEAQNKEYIELVKNLKEQNMLLQKQNEILRSIIELERQQRDAYKTELERRDKQDFFKTIQNTGLGVLIGVVLGVLLL